MISTNIVVNHGGEKLNLIISLTNFISVFVRFSNIYIVSFQLVFSLHVERSQLISYVHIFEISPKFQLILRIMWLFECFANIVKEEGWWGSGLVLANYNMPLRRLLRMQQLANKWLFRTKLWRIAFKSPNEVDSKVSPR